MSRRAHILATGEIYHVYNRSVGHDEIFKDKRALTRWYNILDYYRFPHKIKYSKYKTLPHLLKEAYATSYIKQSPIIELYAFAFMPNHYHLLVKQLSDSGIAKYIGNVQNSFAKFYNLKNDRHGTLFEHAFKAKFIETDEEFLHVSRYIHLNPVTSRLIDVDQLATYPWTSLPHYIKGDGFISSEKILDMLSSKGNFLRFINDQVDYQKKLHDIKHLIIDR